MSGFLLVLACLSVFGETDPAADVKAINGADYDLVVVGGTPGGVACAVRAAREGLRVLLVQHDQHLGGMLTNGLGQWDALYGGERAALFNEFARQIADSYRERYGEKSPQYRAAQFTQKHYPMARFEPSVAEAQTDRLVAAENNITTLKGYIPVSVARDGPIIRTLTLKEKWGEQTVTVRAKVFADATYEGDLAAVCAVPYRVGREGRAEYGEPSAGKVFTSLKHGAGPKDAVEGRLNLHPYGHVQGPIDPTSTHEADAAIQAYNHRFFVTSNPENRLLPDKPANYRREEYLHYNRKSIGNGKGINGKSTMNSAILPGENHRYPEADWPERQRIYERHRDFALGLMYFMQNDESVPAKRRASYRNIGLPRDEFASNGHVPYELYVREGRRIVGRLVFTELDNRVAPGLARTPIYPDSIAITDWSMDSHACTAETRPQYPFDGKLILTEESRPAQIPYRAILPQGVDNLLVPVCLSATHVAWGSVRLEPVWMHVGESAGYAAALAIREGIAPAAIDSDKLVRTLASRGVMVAFFNDFDMKTSDPWVPAVQYFGTKGFFAGYDARPERPLTRATAEVWTKGLASLAKGDSYDANAVARSLPSDESQGTHDSAAIRGGELLRLFQEACQQAGIGDASVKAALVSQELQPDQPMTRGAACQWLLGALEVLRAEGKAPAR